MDNRINRNRLSNFLSYEWILMLGAVAIAIILWELMYTVFAVRLTVGQQFNYYYDENVAANPEAFEKLLTDRETFSFDVLSVSSEHLSSRYNVLNLRLSTKEGDILITETSETEKDGKKTSKANTYIDLYSFYDMDSLYKDGEEYLRGYLKDGAEDPLVFSNLDGEKIKDNFLKRMKGDNRFRSAAQKEEGVKLENKRIESLCKNLADFKKLLDKDDELVADGKESIFYRYTKYAQSLSIADREEDKTRYNNLYEKEKAEGRENVRYGLKTAKLTGGEKDPTYYFTGSVGTGVTAEDVIITVFNFREAQPDLQYETVSFINTVVRECSDFLN